MFAALCKLLTGWFGPPAETHAHAPEPENPKILRSTVEINEIHPEITDSPLSPSGRGAGGEGEAHPVPYDENLLERARTQWQFGDGKAAERIAKVLRES